MTQLALVCGTSGTVIRVCVAVPHTTAVSSPCSAPARRCHRGGDMPLNLQTKLLRVLEEDTIRRVSGKVELLKVSYETLGY